MAENTEINKINFIEITGDLVAAYVANNRVPVADLPNLIQTVNAALTGLLDVTAPPASQDDIVVKPTAAQIRKSITSDGLVSFIDGRSYKTLKRHLRSHGLDADSYRQRYGLPADYPLVAAAYAARRSELAKAIGLGRPSVITPPEPVREEPKQPKARSRKKAA